MGQSEQQARQNSHPLFIARTLIFIKNNNRFLFIKGSPDKHTWPNLFNAIGGHIEKNESIIDSAFRELSEETGLTQENIHKLHFVGVITIALPKDSPGILLFILSGLSTTTNVKESREGSLHWLSPDEILKVPTVEDIPPLMDQILRASNTNSTFIGHYWYDANDKLQTSFSEQSKS
jgi:8-oxo-dGTP pyrophosphatase MutT (NUDIX family)